MFDFLMMNLIAALVPMLFALCKKNQFKKTNRYKIDLSSSGPGLRDETHKCLYGR